MIEVDEKTGKRWLVLFSENVLNPTRLGHQTHTITTVRNHGLVQLHGVCRCQHVTLGGIFCIPDGGDESFARAGIECVGVL